MFLVLGFIFMLHALTFAAPIPGHHLNDPNASLPRVHTCPDLTAATSAPAFPPTVHTDPTSDRPVFPPAVRTDRTAHPYTPASPPAVRAPTSNGRPPLSLFTALPPLHIPQSHTTLPLSAATTRVADSRVDLEAQIPAVEDKKQEEKTKKQNFVETFRNKITPFLGIATVGTFAVSLYNATKKSPTSVGPLPSTTVSPATGTHSSTHTAHSHFAQPHTATVHPFGASSTADHKPPYIDLYFSKAPPPHPSSADHTPPHSSASAPTALPHSSALPPHAPMPIPSHPSPSHGAPSVSLLDRDVDESEDSLYG